MEKSLGKAFIVSLITFMIFSFIFYIIGYSMLEILDHATTRVTDHPSHFVLWITYPFTRLPWAWITEITEEMTADGIKVMDIGFIMAFVLASIIAGIFGGDFTNSLGGWLLTSLVCIISLIAIAFIDSYNIDWLCNGYLCELDETVVQLIIVGLVNLLIFGGVTLVTVLVIGDYTK